MDAPFVKVEPVKPIVFPDPVPTIQYDHPIGPVKEPEPTIQEQFLSLFDKVNKTVSSFTNNDTLKGFQSFASERNDAINRNFSIGQNPELGYGGGGMDMGASWMNLGSEWMDGMYGHEHNPEHVRRHRSHRKKR
jgi:hypothetical protein